MADEKRQVDLPMFFYAILGLVAGCLFSAAIHLARIADALEKIAGAK